MERKRVGVGDRDWEREADRQSDFQLLVADSESEEREAEERIRS